LSEVCAVTPREEAIKAGNQEAAIRAFNLLLSAIVLPERRATAKALASAQSDQILRCQRIFRSLMRVAVAESFWSSRHVG
jgi:hypothetical protein